MSRYQTYQTDYGFITIDTQTEAAPEDYISGPFDNTEEEAAIIEQGAILEVEGDNLVITPDEREPA